ncbi:protein family PM-13 [Methylophilales bacterium HTCC2181]|uniref:Protein family PM-13 n=1 Tax=Methylophilales bacterium HTCC2181 TaxID=383631 RepID=A0P671_9PROT|nr:protein family PM-13 [Methylophilales bacterium HTCC2181]
MEFNIRHLLLLTLVSLIWSSKVHAVGNCGVYETSDKVINYNNNAINLIEDCAIAPASYKLTIYEIGVCTELPAAPGVAAADTSSCTAIFTNAAGQTVNIAVGSSLSLDKSIDLPTGSYGFSYISLSNSLGLTALVDFTTEGVMSDLEAEAGRYCWSETGTRYSSVSFVAPGGVSCSNTPGTPREFIEILDELNEPPNMYSITDDIPVNDGTMNAYITNADGTLATASGVAGGTNIFAILTRTTPLTISDDTKAIDVQFSVNQAMQPDIASLVGGVYTIHGFGSGPFSVNITSE